jgi:hypothetical protein
VASTPLVDELEDHVDGIGAVGEIPISAAVTKKASRPF